MKKINLNAIRIDGGTQARVEIDMAVVADYADAVKAGVDFPSITVYHDGADYWLADGFHRFHAHKQAGKVSIAAEVLNGTVREAILHSLGANGTHGLRRSNADKRKAVQTLLADAEWAQWSDNAIAKACHVSHPFVGSVRVSILKPLQDAPATRTVERNGKTYTQDTTHIGSKKGLMTDGVGKVVHQDGHPLKAPIGLVGPMPESEPAPENHELAEAVLAINELSAENTQLRDRLAVESMDVSEEGKAEAAEIITELRNQVRLLEIELDAVKSSRDRYQRDNADLIVQVRRLNSQIKKQEA